MGINFATDLASGDFEQSLDRQISIHFSSNCYPPVPQFMVQVAIDAIDAVNDQDYGRVIDLPNGVQFRNASWVTASQVIDALRLDAWVFVTE